VFNIPKQKHQLHMRQK